MKKLLICILFLFTFIIYKYNFPLKTIETSINNLTYNLSSEERQFLINNNITYYDILPYLKYNSFNLYDYYKYEQIRIINDYSYLQTINAYNYPNYYNEYIYPSEALYPYTPLVLINKSFFVSKDYNPKSLKHISNYNIRYIERKGEEMMAEKIVLDNYTQMYQDALDSGIELIIYSAFRTYDKQFHLYYNVNKENNLLSAKPGFSEHQGGYSLDISDKTHGLTIHLKDSDTYKWLINNSFKYGFILRYPENKTKITKYSFEPWHFRFVGQKHSERIMKEKITLEEYLFNNYEL